MFTGREQARLSVLQNWVLDYHKSIDSLTPADVYFGRGHTILLHTERIKRQTIAKSWCVPI
jgi:hypothetical protein